MATQYHGKEKKLKDKKLVIYKKVDLAHDTDGYAISEYRPIHPGSLWAYVRQIGGNEYIARYSVSIEETILFVVNWRADLLTENAWEYFILYRGHWYDIKRIDTYEGYKSDIFIYADTAKKGVPLSEDQVKPYAG